MSAIELCRTAELGGHVEGCRSCGTIRIAYNSCRNRHCPKCQGQACREWLAARQDELLPVPYFHVVFTLPAQIAAIAFQNKAVVYAILFKAAAETLRTIAADPKHLGAEIGLDRGAAQLGPEPALPSAHPLHRAGWRSVARRHALDLLPARLLPARACAVAPVSPALSGGTASGLRCGQAGLLRRSRPPGAARRLQPPACRGPSPRMGRLRQAAVRRPGAGAGLSRPLHPPRRHRQFPTDQHGRRQGRHSAGEIIVIAARQRS